MKDLENNEKEDAAESKSKSQFQTQDTENKEHSFYNFTDNRKFKDSLNNIGEELSEKKENQEKIVKIKDENDLTEKTVDDSIKNIFCLIICLSIIYTVIGLIISIFSLLLFDYYNNCKLCKSKIYPKINNIKTNCCWIIFLKILSIVNQILMILPMKSFQFYKCCGFLILLLLSIIDSVLNIINIVIVQMNMLKTESWENCGYFKTWMILWLIINYFFIIINLKKTCSSKK